MRTRRKMMKGGSQMVKAKAIIALWRMVGNIDKELNLSDLKLTSLPNIPDNVRELYISNNKLTSLPQLPPKLEILVCDSNNLTTLPELPNNLKSLFSNNNNLTSLPELPNSLESLYCNNNKLTTLPELPDRLQSLYCNNNILPNEYNMKYNENMRQYIQRIRDLQSNNINSSETKEVNSNAKNYIAFENIKNGNVLVNLKRSANKYNSNYKEYITKNTYNTMLHKTLKHPLTRYTMKKKNIKYYTAKKKNNSK